MIGNLELRISDFKLQITNRKNEDADGDEIEHEDDDEDEIDAGANGSVCIF